MEVGVSGMWFCAFWLPGDQTLVVSLTLLVRVYIDPNTANPLQAAGHSAVAMQRILIQLTHPTCDAEKRANKNLLQVILKTPPKSFENVQCFHELHCVMFCDSLF